MFKKMRYKDFGYDIAIITKIFLSQYQETVLLNQTYNIIAIDATKQIVAIETLFLLSPLFTKIKNTENLRPGFSDYGKITILLFKYFLIRNFK